MGVFAMPSLGSDMESGKLVEWLVRPGDNVARGDVVAVVETQKGAIEIETFEDGTVHALVADLGADLPVGAPLAVILGAGEAPPATPTPATPTPAPEPETERARAPEAPADAAMTAAPPARPAPPPAPPPGVPKGQVAASPAARARAQALGIDLATLSGSGPGGVVVLADVEAQAASPAPAAPARGTPMEEMRKAIAAAMTRSKQTIPHFSLSQTMDLQPAMDFLARRNAGRPPAERLLLGALFVRAVARAVADVPTLNGHYEGGAFRPAATVNPGVAVALRGGGLVAPAIRDALSRDLDGTMAAMRDLVSRARAGRLRNSEMTDGTITVSALGDSGAEAMTGVIFPPQVALVALGAPQTRPWVVDGQVLPRPVVTLTVAADHRVADGRQVARFIAGFEALITDPEAL